MNPKILIFIGLMVLSLVLLVIIVVLPQGIVFVPIKFVLLVLGIISCILGFASRYYTYLLIPMMRQRKKNVVISDQSAYWISTTGESIVRKEGEDFIATVFINIPLYISASEMTDEQKVAFTAQISRLVGLSTTPVRFTAELYLMNKDKYIQKLKDSIGDMESQEAALVAASGTANQDPKKNEMALEHVRGKQSMLKKMLDNVGSETSFELGSFATVSASGSRELEAINLAQVKAKELMNGIGTTLGVPPSIVVGNEILKYIEPEFLIPYSTVAEQITRNIRQEVS